MPSAPSRESGGHRSIGAARSARQWTRSTLIWRRRARPRYRHQIIIGVIIVPAVAFDTFAKSRRRRA